MAIKLSHVWYVLPLHCPRTDYKNFPEYWNGVDGSRRYPDCDLVIVMIETGTVVAAIPEGDPLWAEELGRYQYTVWGLSMLWTSSR